MRVVVIAPNVSLHMGGEAIKAYQFFTYLLAQGYDAYLCTHERCRAAVMAAFPAERVILIPDSWGSVALAKHRHLSAFSNVHFQIKVRQVLARAEFEDAIWHFITPISPVEPKLYPRGQKTVIGPLNGNIFNPPTFRDRMRWKRQAAMRLYRPVQQLMGTVLGDKKRAYAVLNSGFDRTRQALEWCGVEDDKIVDVLDAGIPSDLLSSAPLHHVGRNTKFVSIGRLDDFKAHDLMIRALAQTREDYTLTIFGDGARRAELEHLAQELGVAPRVFFAGWLDHTQLIKTVGDFRAFLFPSLAEANGIVMQEMMALGLPVIALRWGGPIALAPDNAALFVDPSSPDDVVSQLAVSMTRLAEDPVMANVIASNARAVAKARFDWHQVGASWASAYVMSDEEAEGTLDPLRKRAKTRTRHAYS